MACFTIPLFGMLSDVWSRKGAVLSRQFAADACWPLPYYAMLATRQPLAILLATIVMLGVVHAMLYGVQAALISELFPTRLRYTGASLAYQLAGPFAGGAGADHRDVAGACIPGSYWPLAAYIMLLAVVSMICVHLLSETAHKDISG